MLAHGYAYQLTATHVATRPGGRVAAALVVAVGFQPFHPLRHTATTSGADYTGTHSTRGRHETEA